MQHCDDYRRFKRHVLSTARLHLRPRPSAYHKRSPKISFLFYPLQRPGSVTVRTKFKSREGKTHQKKNFASVFTSSSTLRKNKGNENKNNNSIMPFTSSLQLKKCPEISFATISSVAVKLKINIANQLFLIRRYFHGRNPSDWLSLTEIPQSTPGFPAS